LLRGVRWMLLRRLPAHIGKTSTAVITIDPKVKRERSQATIKVRSARLEIQVG
jgi:hypothetical protein